MATRIELSLAHTKTALKVAYDQAARAEKAAASKYGEESPITKELAQVRMRINAAMLSAQETK